MTQFKGVAALCCNLRHTRHTVCLYTKQEAMTMTQFKEIAVLLLSPKLLQSYERPEYNKSPAKQYSTFVGGLECKLSCQ